jgi:hypothetical protein
MSNPCLIIFSRSEAPALNIDLLPGQIYAGKDDRETGCMALIISLGDHTQLTAEQDNFLFDHPDVLRFDVFSDCGGRDAQRYLRFSLPDSTDDFLSHRDGKTLIPLSGDEPIWRRNRGVC